VLVTPSATASDGDQEGIPNVLKEAMASGMPVVATRHAGIPELVRDGVTGLLVPEHDPSALTVAVRALHDHPEMWPTLTHAARAVIEKEYDIEKQNDRLVEIYQQVVAKGQSRPD
jgi:colanic acid/amylovoran biosynthesis glycosyltransferase